MTENDEKGATEKKGSKKEAKHTQKRQKHRKQNKSHEITQSESQGTFLLNLAQAFVCLLVMCDVRFE